ncbi:Tn3 family transposase [Streptomyces sp. NPDC098085]|uniref:Tn3 family transposase n=1 Tax=Streptomyces sp. NPDC098085 TaxID=3366094 RepID=UPI00381D7AD4
MDEDAQPADTSPRAHRRGALPRFFLLALLALETSMGIRATVATGEHGESEATLRHASRHSVTADNLRAAVATLVNATFAACSTAWWGPWQCLHVEVEEARILSKSYRKRW